MKPKEDLQRRRHNSKENRHNSLAKVSLHLWSMAKFQEGSEQRLSQAL